MTADVTASAGEAYAACKTLFEDLNQLATDFCRAIRDMGIDLPKQEQYSYGPNDLSIKRDHVWMAHRTDADGHFSFAAAYVIFARGKNHVKIGPPGRPEVWYILGRATKPEHNLSMGVRNLFRNEEQSLYQPKLAVGGTISLYTYKDDQMTWSAVLIGFELGDVDSPETLKQRVVSPLMTAAKERSFNL